MKSKFTSKSDIKSICHSELNEVKSTITQMAPIKQLQKFTAETNYAPSPQKKKASSEMEKNIVYYH